MPQSGRGPCVLLHGKPEVDGSDRLQERPSMSAEIGGVDVLSVDWCCQAAN